MNKEFVEAFSLLDNNEKRNQISNELMLIGELINSVKVNYGMHGSSLSIKNYDSNADTMMTESEMLDFLYEDIYSIERELITLFACIDVLRNNN